MGKVIRDAAAGDISDDQRRKTVREEKKVRTKKKKRKRDLTDLHQRLFKTKKQNRRNTCELWQSSFVKLLHRFTNIRQEYEKEAKIDHKSSKQQNSKKTSNRILPRPCAGIYRNGAAGKEIRRSQVPFPPNDLNNARLDGNVLKLLHGYDSKSECIVIGNDTREVPKDPLLDTAIKDILQPTPPGVQCTSPVLGKVDGKKKIQKNSDDVMFIDVPQKSLEKRKPINSENISDIALSKYEELCRFISAENFEGQHFPDQFTSDPLTVVKRKLRSIYAESFRSQFLRDMIKRGTILNEYETPSTFVETQFPAEFAYCPSGYTHEADLVSVTIENPDCDIGCQKDKADELQGSQDPFSIADSNFNVEGKRNAVPSSSLLFDFSVLDTSNGGLKNIFGHETTKNAENTGNEDTKNHTSLEVNRSTSSTCRNNLINNLQYFQADTWRTKEKHKSAAFVPMDAGLQYNLANKRHLIRRKNQRTQATHLVNSGLKRHVGKQSLKVPQQIKIKNLKHIPAILRRCSNPVANNNSRLNLFQESMHINKESREMLFNAASKQNVLFSPESLRAELNENSRKLQTSNSDSTSNVNAKDLNVRNCVIASPSLRNDNVCFLEPSRSHLMDTKNQTQNLRRKDIFVKRNPPIQKTVMFTKKDSRNIGHCLHLNSLIADGTVDNSNVCIIKKNVPVQQEKSIKNTCALHRNCYRAFHCSQESSGSDYGSQEFNETTQVQKPMVCEKVLLRRVQQPPKCENNQKCRSDQHVCYVVVDQCKDSNNLQGCTTDNVSQVEKSRMLQAGHFCQDDMADVGILKGVQNLKILPVEERESQMKFVNNECIESAVVIENQPIKYLAFENDSKTQKVPIYMQKNKHVTAVDNVEVINPNVNYRVVSCPQESAQKIIFVPACEQNKVVYVKQPNLGHSHVSFEECSHPRKVVLYRPEVQCVQSNSNVCEVHVPKQNVMEMRKNECDAVVANLQQADNLKKLRRSGVNWEELHYRPRHEHSLLNDACVRGQAIFYQK